MGNWWSHLNEPVLMAGPKPLLTKLWHSFYIGELWFHTNAKRYTSRQKAILVNIPGNNWVEICWPCCQQNFVCLEILSILCWQCDVSQETLAVKSSQLVLEWDPGHIQGYSMTNWFHVVLYNAIVVLSFSCLHLPLSSIEGIFRETIGHFLQFILQFQCDASTEMHEKCHFSRKKSALRVPGHIVVRQHYLFCHCANCRILLSLWTLMNLRLGTLITTKCLFTGWNRTTMNQVSSTWCWPLRLALSLTSLQPARHSAKRAGRDISQSSRISFRALA